VYILVSKFIVPLLLPFMVFMGYIVLICLYAFLLPRWYVWSDIVHLICSRQYLYIILTYIFSIICSSGLMISKKQLLVLVQCL